MQQKFLPLLYFTFLSMTWMIKIAKNTKLEVITIMLDDRHHMQIRNKGYQMSCEIYIWKPTKCIKADLYKVTSKAGKVLGFKYLVLIWPNASFSISKIMSIKSMKYPSWESTKRRVTNIGCWHSKPLSGKIES